jgi:hypothetical protein
MTLTLDPSTLDRFRDRHGDPTKWCAADIDSYTVLGELAPPVPPLYSYAEMQTIADDYEKSSICQQAVADRLTAEGHSVFTALRHVGESDDGDSDTRDIACEALTLLIQAHTGSPTARAMPWSERLGRTHADIAALLTAGAEFARTYGPGAEAEAAA